ncbi:Potassium transport protein [Mycena sanguinolenta]|uniref:Potassium transport protein n=1 Tax=Mycena sanguinolenta TaxID=230812 RepID=A0A8H6Y3G1_9AGAR|nr:Potassium transport protein [Mycena sanguinolenta]
MNSISRAIRKHLNFYRVHILFFTFTPLIFSGIFYASNGQYHVSYIDALFNCVSAMTVCGLATVDLSSLTGWQQVILFIQMCLGSPVVVSWVMVYMRKYYFAKKFEHIIEAAKARAIEIGDGWISEGAQTPAPEVENKDPIEVQEPAFTETLVSSPQPIPEEKPSSPSSSHLRAPPGRRISDPGRTSPQPSSPITPSFPRSGTIPAHANR